jgi:hypothetical protein
MSDDDFEYEIEIPATVAKIRLSKQKIYAFIEEQLERELTEEEKEIAWEEFSSHDDFYNMFPGEAAKVGCNMYGASDYETYVELFEQEVKRSIQESIDATMQTLWDTIFDRTLDDVIDILAKDEEQEEVSMTTPLPPLPPSPTPAVVENDNKYIEFLKEQHPLVKAANPTWTPQQIIVAIGHKWSFEQMSVEKKSGNIRVKHKTGKVTIDSCGKPDELKVFLDAYRAKHGHEAFFEFAKKVGVIE